MGRRFTPLEIGNAYEVVTIVFSRVFPQTIRRTSMQFIIFLALGYIKNTISVLYF